MRSRRRPRTAASECFRAAGAARPPAYPGRSQSRRRPPPERTSFVSEDWIRLRAWLLMLPLLAVMIAVIGWPAFDTVRLSFADAKLVGTEGSFTGLDNYRRMLASTPVHAAFRNTALFTIVSVALEMVLGVLAALLLDQEFRGR